jgi:hypothetical protein
MNSPTPTPPKTPSSTAPSTVSASNGSAKPVPSVSPSSTKAVPLRGAPPFAIQSPSSAESRWFKGLFYGVPGAGKTTLVGTCADIDEMQDVLYLDAERGYEAIPETDRIKMPQRILENRVPINDFFTIAKVHDFLRAHCKFRDENNEAKLREQESWIRGCSPDEIITPKRFRTVIVDTATEIDTYCNYNILGVTQEILTEEAKSGDNMETAGWPEFRKVNQMMQMLMRAFRDLPIHVLATAHRTYAEDEQKKRYYAPAFTGQLRTQIPGFFDVVGYMQIETKTDGAIERQLMVKPVGRFEAKNRRSVYKENSFKDPTMRTIMEGVRLLKV